MTAFEAGRALREICDTMVALEDAQHLTEIKGLLHQIYIRVWPEVHYSPYNEATERFAEELWPFLERLNEILKFNPTKET